ncbi:MAG: hypothetical protein ABIV43_03110 [Candidatus Saccharimonadales bacterium]
MAVTVEIMHDQASGTLPTEAVQLGIQLLAPLVGELMVVRDDRQIRVADPALDIVRSDRIRWPRLPANFTLVLTDRQLCSAAGDELSRKAGVAAVGADVAIITLDNAAGQAGVSMTTAHEMGHLYEVLDPWSSAEAGHCVDDSCLMFPISVRMIDVIRTDETTRLKRMKSRLGLHQIESVRVPSRSKFCASCEVDLIKQSRSLAPKHAQKLLKGFVKG